MKIGLIDVDGHNFPNLPLMKYRHTINNVVIQWNGLICLNIMTEYICQRFLHLHRILNIA